MYSLGRRHEPLQGYHDTHRKLYAIGNGLPFIATVSRASLPSITFWTGGPKVNPSTEVHISCRR
jgi:hypothetical protein